MRGLETLKALWGKGLRVHHHMRGLEKENRLDEKEATRSPPHAWLRNFSLISSTATSSSPPHAWLRNAHRLLCHNPLGSPPHAWLRNHNG